MRCFHLSLPLFGLYMVQLPPHILRNIKNIRCSILSPKPLNIFTICSPFFLLKCYIFFLTDKNFCSLFVVVVVVAVVVLYFSHFHLKLLNGLYYFNKTWLKSSEPIGQFQLNLALGTRFLGWKWLMFNGWYKLKALFFQIGDNVVLVIFGFFLKPKYSGERCGSCAK